MKKTSTTLMKKQKRETTKLSLLKKSKMYLDQDLLHNNLTLLSSDLQHNRCSFKKHSGKKLETIKMILNFEKLNSPKSYSTNLHLYSQHFLGLFLIKIQKKYSSEKWKKRDVKSPV
jgi:hypothetical protein